MVDDRDADGNGGTGAPELLLAGIGWLSLGVEAVDELAGELASRVGIERTELRDAIRDTIASWRAEARKVGAHQDELTEQMLRRLGLARREEIDDLQLRLAQLEHRLRLVERPGE
jgi:polyhydroxyalkanoate synthesis regulator phasin